MKKNKVYISGCGGMLGEAFYKIFSTDCILKCTDIDVNEDWLDYLDFRNLKDYRIDVENFMPDYLIHLGAHTDLEYCEINQDDAYLTNTISVENASMIANDLNIPVIFISTAGIFDGSKQYYNDWDAPNPLCIYAKSKFYAEKYIISNSKKFLILRAGWMMGGGFKKDKKFVNKIMNQVKNKKKILNVVNDKMGTPTYTVDFALNTKLLIDKGIWGLYNLVSRGKTNRFEVANEILKILHLNNKIKINSVSSDFFKKEYFAPRPPSEQLINYKLQLRSLDIMRDWKICLKEYIHDCYKDIFQ